MLYQQTKRRKNAITSFNIYHGFIDIILYGNKHSEANPQGLDRKAWEIQEVCDSGLSLDTSIYRQNVHGKYYRTNGRCTAAGNYHQ
jgi:hypothetical protein